ncbi:MAG: YqeG family HAD IIIA-type phosphatase [Oscillospiraceae bacterium]|nr:YqeG family HAD IIIA-type phosphatase [Oscillospiraceae bacterium]
MKLRPDYYYESITDLSASFFLDLGVKGLMVDLDNTLTGDGSPHLSDEVGDWIRRMQAAGIKLLIVSNNHEPRVLPFAETAGLPFMFEAGKPSPACLTKALRILELQKCQTAMVGDQYFTDILFAKRCGVISVLLEPVGEDRHTGAGLKRFFERAVRSSPNRGGRRP